MSGWLKRGPSGIIGSNIPDARETVGCVLADLASGALPGAGESERGALEALRELLRARGRTPASLVSWAGYKEIEAAEKAAGAAAGKPREKFTDVPAMLAAAAAKAAEGGPAKA